MAIFTFIEKYKKELELSKILRVTFSLNSIRISVKEGRREHVEDDV